MEVKIFVNNPWGENTILLYDETKEAVVIDCGCFSEEERKRFASFLSDNGLVLKGILNTHLHIDHIFGNGFVKETYGLEPQANEGDNYLIEEALNYAKMMGITGIEQPPAIGHFLQDGDVVKFGTTELKVIATPGHSPGGLCFYSEKDHLLVSGDTLFSGSVGRSDLPGGNGSQLLQGIKSKLFILPDDVVVIPGHGPQTTIREEKLYNPFFA
ncbi:MBL fold metallo-hydrolase [Porphyromonadaceae bacterium OttesenSCG-928-L07]|nr:MBL fold metallo-hydrolase [Porphyromonadaceae bacterium OttesenSCG-928-L07]MDL2252221.1 MBL fold metallo-hydrolase [Odoribacter sp. OttesenSCG-928-J03]